MRIISFGWTTPPLVARQKFCTRRDWDHEYAVRFLRGEYIQAYDKSPRYKGRPLGTIQLTETPVYTGILPEEDFALEGFDFCRRHGLTIDKIKPDVLWRAWHLEAQTGRRWWVVRFEVMSLSEYGTELAAEWAEKEKALPWHGGTLL